MIFSKIKHDFGAIEILITLTIISVIAAIAIPSLLASRRTTNEWKAKESLWDIATAQEQFRTLSTNTDRRYGSLAELARAGLIDVELENGEKSGYKFTVETDGSIGFVIKAYQTQASGILATGGFRFGMTEERDLHGDEGLGGKLTPYESRQEIEAARKLALG
jgi:Tfp pilus assembly protein PilE